MSLSEELRKLADQAQEAEERATAAKDKARADVEQDVELSRAVAQNQAEQLREAADAGRGKISDWWDDLQKDWSEHLARVQQGIQDKKAERDLAKSERNADNAEDDAAFAIDFAYSAVVEAEYAVLDAVLARKEAEELSSGSVSA
jgi:hypothetical protein